MSNWVNIPLGGHWWHCLFCFLFEMGWWMTLWKTPEASNDVANCKELDARRRVGYSIQWKVLKSDSLPLLIFAAYTMIYTGLVKLSK